MPATITREEFLNDLWTYHPGQHVLMVAPTGAGKSYFAWQLLDGAMQQNPHLQPVVYMPKKKDPTTKVNANRLGLAETPTWPPRKPGLFEAKPVGHVLWPVHPYGPGIDTNIRRNAVGAQLRKGLESQLVKGDSISFVDDAHSAAAMFDLNPLIEETLVNGRAGGSGVWMATQKPSGTAVSGGLTTYAYSSGSHMFFSKDNDKRNLERLSEIGAGFDPQKVAGWVRNLNVHTINGEAVGDFLYLNRSGEGCIVLPW
jgi:hypothetical protein